MSSKAIKILGIVASVVGMIAPAITDYVNQRKTEEMIEEKVNEALASRDEEKTES